jgi:hypothetical protein
MAVIVSQGINHKGTKTPSFYFLCLCVLVVQYGLPYDNYEPSL